MNNTKRYIIFVICFITIIMIISFVMPRYTGLFGDTFYFINGILTLILILFPLMQMTIRLAYTHRYFKHDHEFFALPIKASMAYYRLMHILFIGLLLGYPIIKGLLNPSELMIYATAIGIWLVVTEIIVSISQKTTKAHFCHQHLIIKGIDLRMDLPVGDAIKSHSGVYFYEDFRIYTCHNDLLTLYLTDGIGKIQIAVSDDMQQQALSYLSSKKLVFKEHHRI